MDLNQTHLDIIQLAYHFVLERKGSRYLLKALDCKNKVWFTHAFDKVLDAMQAIEDLKEKTRRYNKCVCSA